jgi:hypothetical protein
VRDTQGPVQSRQQCEPFHECTCEHVDGGWTSQPLQHLRCCCVEGLREFYRVFQTCQLKDYTVARIVLCQDQPTASMVVLFRRSTGTPWRREEVLACSQPVSQPASEAWHDSTLPIASTVVTTATLAFHAAHPIHQTSRLAS